MRYLVAKLLVATIFVFNADDAAACSCVSPSFAETFERSANIFTAVVDDRRHQHTPGEATIATSRFRITETFKGTQLFDAIVSYPAGSCGLYLEVGVEYLFFVPDSGLAHLCSGTREAARAIPEISALRSFTSGQSSTLEEPWHFFSEGGGCTFLTGSHAAASDVLGSVSFVGKRAGEDGTLESDSAQLLIRLLIGSPAEHMTLLVAGTAYGAALEQHGRAYAVYAVTGDDAVQILRRLRSATSLRVNVQNQGTGPDIDIEVSTANLAQAGTVEKMLECMSSPAEPQNSTAALEANADGFNLKANSPYVPGFDQLQVGDSLDAVANLFATAAYDGSEWSVRLDHPVFLAIRYSPRGMPSSRDPNDGRIKRVEYVFEPDAAIDEAAARFRAEAIERWPYNWRQTGPNGFRTVWRDFAGRLVTLDRSKLAICVECEYPPP